MTEKAKKLLNAAPLNLCSMYNKLSDSYNKKHIYNYEDEPPEKKLISDGDIFIKKLAEKQRNTKINLEQQLTLNNPFCKSTELVSLTNYTSGPKSLTEFSSVIQHLNNLEVLKSCGLTDEEIELVNCYKTGKESLGREHKNINKSVLKQHLDEIYEKIKNSSKEDEICVPKCSRLKNELLLSTKPSSIETKLLKFALENEEKQKELPGPMDDIKQVEQQLVKNISPVNIKKIRKRARNLAKQITLIEDPPLEEPKIRTKSVVINSNTKWDSKQRDEITKLEIKEKKTYSCQSQNFYTIKNGEIVKVNSPESETKKLTIDEIKKISKFQNYEKGEPSKVLYLKNLANGVRESDLECVFQDFMNDILSIKIMTGRMQGQVFIELTNETIAERILDEFNGLIIKNKPIIIQFGKRKNL